jgi:hypothetical protein
LQYCFAVTQVSVVGLTSFEAASKESALRNSLRAKDVFFELEAFPSPELEESP